MAVNLGSFLQRAADDLGLSVPGNLIEQAAQAIKTWGEGNVADPVREAVESFHTSGQREVAEPIRRLVEQLHSWGQRNVADPLRQMDPELLPNIWFGMVQSWASEEPVEAAARGVPAVTDSFTADAFRQWWQSHTGVSDSTEAAARRDPRFGSPDGSPVAPGEDLAPFPAATPPGVTTAEDQAPTPAPNSGTPATPGGGTPATGGDDHDHAGEGQPLGADRLPEGGQLWLVDGKHYYIAYTIPGTDIPLLWRVENPDRLQDLYGTGKPAVDRTVAQSELDGMGAWIGGVSKELDLALGDDPFDIFLERFYERAELRPWLNDPTFLAVSATAYLEGRTEISADELQQVDWYNEHTDEQRAWMERSVTASDAQLASDLNDALSVVMEGLRGAGMNNPPESLARYIATQRLTGEWSEEKTRQQVRKVADPFAPGELDPGLRQMLADPQRGTVADAKVVSQGIDAVKERVRSIFNNRRVPIAGQGETEDERLTRIASEVVAGGRSLADVRESVDRLAASTPGGSVGGLDVTQQGEDQVRTLINEWVGPQVGQGYDEAFVREWAGKIRNDPDAQQQLVELLQGAAMEAFDRKNPNSRYIDIVGPTKSLFTNVWGTAPDEMDPLFLDVLKMQSYTEAAQLLRKEGLQRGVGKTVDDALSGLGSSPIGQQVVRSTI